MAQYQSTMDGWTDIKHQYHGCRPHQLTKIILFLTSADRAIFRVFGIFSII